VAAHGLERRSTQHSQHSRHRKRGENCTRRRPWCPCRWHWWRQRTYLQHILQQAMV